MPTQTHMTDSDCLEKEKRKKTKTKTGYSFFFNLA